MILSDEKIGVFHMLRGLLITGNPLV